MSSSSGNQNVIVTADGENSFDSIVLDSFSPKATTMVNEEETPSILFGAFYLIWKGFHLLLGSLYRLLHGQDFLHQPSPPKSIRPIFPRIHELPCEIRLLIFTECLRKRKDPDTKRPLPEIAPGLIPALRAHPKMYGEALQVYYKINFMVLSVEKCASLEDLTNDTLKYVRALAVHIRGSPNFLRLLKLQKATNVKSLQIVVGAPSLAKTHFESTIFLTAESFHNLEQLSIWFFHPWGLTDSSQNRIDFASKILGISFTRAEHVTPAGQRALGWCWSRGT